MLLTLTSDFLRGLETICVFGVAWSRESINAIGSQQHLSTQLT